MDDRDAIRVAAAAIAHSLGEEWRSADGDGSMRDALLYGPDEIVLDLHSYRMHASDPLRVEIRGRFPPDVPSPLPASRTCAVRRGDRAIARDIGRHLLPVFTEQLAKVRKEAVARAHDIADRARVMAEVEQILGQKMTCIGPAEVVSV